MGSKRRKMYWIAWFVPVGVATVIIGCWVVSLVLPTANPHYQVGAVSPATQNYWDPDRIMAWPQSVQLIAAGNGVTRGEYEYAIFIEPTHAPSWGVSGQGNKPVEQEVFTLPQATGFFLVTQEILGEKTKQSSSFPSINSAVLYEFTDNSGARCKWSFWKTSHETYLEVERFK